MAWSRFDDSWADHPKVIAAGNEAAGLFTRAVAWSNRHLTDGVVPIGVITMMAGSVKRGNFLIMVLCEVGLLDHRSDESVTIHDYLEYNPSRSDVQAKRQHISEVRRHAGEAGGKQRASKRQANAKQRSSPDSTKQNPSPEPVPVPDRTRTEPPLTSPPESRSLALAGNGSENGFDEWYALYPRHKGKEAARAVWKRLHPDATMVAMLCDAVRRQREWADWRKDGGQFVPYPAKWLRHGMWADERDPAPVAFTGRTSGNAAAVEQFLLDRRVARGES